MFYRGKKAFPQWDGSGIVSGMASHTLTRIVFDGKGGAKPAERWELGNKRIRDVAEAPDGTLWLLEDANPGALIHVTPK
jgi:glucose/arabinose dehydrogenase